MRTVPSSWMHSRSSLAVQPSCTSCPLFHCGGTRLSALGAARRPPSPRDAPPGPCMKPTATAGCLEVQQPWLPQLGSSQQLSPSLTSPLPCAHPAGKGQGSWATNTAGTVPSPFPLPGAGQPPSCCQGCGSCTEPPPGELRVPRARGSTRCPAGTRGTASGTGRGGRGHTAQRFTPRCHSACSATGDPGPCPRVYRCKGQRGDSRTAPSSPHAANPEHRGAAKPLTGTAARSSPEAE